MVDKVQLKVRHQMPDGGYLYIGPRQMVDALTTATDCFVEIQKASWWVRETEAKVFTSVGHLKQLVGRARSEPWDTFSRLEVVVLETGEVVPMDTVCPPQPKRRPSRPSSCGRIQ